MTWIVYMGADSRALGPPLLTAELWVIKVLVAHQGL